MAAVALLYDVYSRPSVPSPAWRHVFHQSIGTAREFDSCGTRIELASTVDSSGSIPKLAAPPMPCSLPRLARTPTLPTTAPTCLLRPRARLLLVHGSSGAAAAATPPVTAVASTDLTCSHYTSVAASPSLRASSSMGRARGGSGLVGLTITASAVAVSACLVFLSAIRSLLACKREAELLEKYFDSARAKLPETMASVRLGGREIGDLAADLSDLSQEWTKGVKTSMRIVHTAEAQLQQPRSTRPGSLLRMSNQNNRLDETLLASTVRHLRELIADIRSGFGTASGIASTIMWAFNFGSKHL